MRLTGAMVFLMLIATGGCTPDHAAPPTDAVSLPEFSPASRPWTFVEGAPVRGDVSRKQTALIFTGGEFGQERTDPRGLNGFLLLLHLGSERKDKVHPHLGRLLDELAARG